MENLKKKSENISYPYLCKIERHNLKTKKQEAKTTLTS